MCLCVYDYIKKFVFDKQRFFKVLPSLELYELWTNFKMSDSKLSAEWIVSSFEKKINWLASN
jgi:hypothetical protein